MDVPAPGVGAVCGACPLGYTGDAQKCYGQFKTLPVVQCAMCSLHSGPSTSFSILYVEKLVGIICGPGSKALQCFWCNVTTVVLLCDYFVQILMSAF